MAKDFCSQQVVDGYDQHIRKLIPGYELIHQQILAILQAHLPKHAHVLIIGAGTGYELSYLLQAFPQCTFTVTELSQPMLDKAKQAVSEWNTDNRVQFILGSHTHFDFKPQYDAVLSILVTHFVPFAKKPEFIKAARASLKSNGIFLSFDLTQFSFAQEAESLNRICLMNGLREQQVQAMQSRMNDDFYALSANETLELLSEAGFSKVSAFTQIFSYQGFIAQH